MGAHSLAFLDPPTARGLRKKALVSAAAAAGLRRAPCVSSWRRQGRRTRMACRFLVARPAQLGRHHRELPPLQARRVKVPCRMTPRLRRPHPSAEAAVSAERLGGSRLLRHRHRGADADLCRGASARRASNRVRALRDARFRRGAHCLHRVRHRRRCDRARAQSGSSARTIGMEIFYYLLLDHVAPAHASLVVRLAIPAAMLTGFLLFKRRPPTLAVLGATIVLAGIVPLIVTVPADHRMAVIVSGLPRPRPSTCAALQRVPSLQPQRQDGRRKSCA